MLLADFHSQQDTIVYDNNFGASDDADPDTEIQDGSIVIDQGKGVT
ncbi:MAG: hypothetical protein V3T40_02645 [Nitrososphaerales archaeon]